MNYNKKKKNDYCSCTSVFHVITDETGTYCVKCDRLLYDPTPEDAEEPDYFFTEDNEQASTHES